MGYVTLSKGKFVAIFVGGAIVCSVVGIACWFGRAPPSSAMPNDSLPTEQPQECEDFLPETAPWLNLHLPAYTVPKHYDLTLHPDFYGENSRFTGVVIIEIDVKQATWYLLVHIKRLNVKVTSVKNKGTGAEYGINKQSGYEPNQFWIVRTNKLIEESATVLLEIEFDGSLSDGIVGFYKAFYANNTKAMATSKFEPVDARKAFPCFDEPNLKATFTTTLVHRSDYTALSNMPVQMNTTRSDGLIATTFQKSVPMSTYLACFIVCQCNYEEKILKSGKKFRVYAVEGSEDQIQYALEFGANVTDYFEEYFGLDYPLPKMDMIAIPDFVSGAMEHWGLITYRETNLLYKEGVSSPSNKQRIAEVVAHELAHQWFGNIVTMDWWDDLWLNEGFATFMSYVGTAPFEPDMEVFSQFAVVEAFYVMPQDSVASSHPIIVPVNRPEDITAVFDAISYNKGASVIRMLEAFVGTDVFQEGLAAYLKRYQYDNAKTYQLWDSISDKVKDWDIKLIMDTWTKQSGFPLVTITYDSQTNKIEATQELYRDKDDDAKWQTSEFGYLWEVPLHYVSSAGRSGSKFPWLHSNSSTVEFTNPVDMGDAAQWIKFNKGTTGYYKVNYPTEWWQKFGSLLNDDVEALPVADRAGLVYDAITLPSYKHMTYSTALQFLTYMANETHYVPWSAVSSELFRLRNLAIDTNAWETFVQELVRKSYERYGWEKDGKHLDKLLRGTIIRLACGHEYSDCLTSAKDKFTQWLADPEINPLDSALRYYVLYYGMTDVTEEEWNIVWNRYNMEPVASAKVDMRRGLAKTKDANIIRKYLGYAMDREKVADQDFFSVVSYISSNKVGLPIVWDWVRENYETIMARFGLDNRYFGRMIPGIASRFTTADKLAEVNEFFAQQPDAGSGKRAREQALEGIQESINWKGKYGNDVDQWLKSR